MPGQVTRPLLRFLARTPVHTFVLMPIVVAACELIWRGGTLAFDPWGVPLLVLGYAQYRLVGQFRSQHGGGGPGVDVPPTRLVTEGPFRFTRNPMYLALCLLQVALGFFLNDWITLLFVVPLALILHYGVILREERYLTAKFGEPYLQLKRDVRRWF